MFLARAEVQALQQHMTSNHDPFLYTMQPPPASLQSPPPAEGTSCMCCLPGLRSKLFSSSMRRCCRCSTLSWGPVRACGRGRLDSDTSAAAAAPAADAASGAGAVGVVCSRVKVKGCPARYSCCCCQWRRVGVELLLLQSKAAADSPAASDGARGLSPRDSASRG